jgi:mannose-6-phosphate isomerase-like protein (cupin superfamily)
MASTSGIARPESHSDVTGAASRLAAEADDRGAQLAMAVESISDGLAQLVLEVAELRSAVVEQRIVLDELRARSHDSSSLEVEAQPLMNSDPAASVLDLCACGRETRPLGRRQEDRVLIAQPGDPSRGIHLARAGEVRLEECDLIYLALEGSGVLGVETDDVLALVPGEAIVVPAGTRHVLFGNPRLTLLTVGTPAGRPTEKYAARSETLRMVRRRDAPSMK